MYNNPILTNLVSNSGSSQQNSSLPLQQIKNLVATMKSSQNPMLFLQNALVQNPQLQSAIDYVKSNGGNPQQAFYRLAQQKGINPDEILNLLK